MKTEVFGISTDARKTTHNITHRIRRPQIDLKLGSLQFRCKRENFFFSFEKVDFSSEVDFTSEDTKIEKGFSNSSRFLATHESVS